MPWVDRPASPPPPPPSPQPPPALFADCGAGQIRAHGADEGAAAGNLSTRITLTNVDHAPCTLGGYPTRLIGIKADGRTTVLRPFHGTMFDQESGWTANLRAGESASVTIATADACAARNRPQPPKRAKRDAYVGEIIGLPGGGAVTARGPFNSACGVGVSPIGRPARPAPDPHEYRGLKLTVDRPDSAVAGTTMRFTVALTNRSDHAVALVPCPIYQEGMYAGRRAYRATYSLNCDTVHSIPAGQRVTYAMQISVPPATGMAKFGWSIPQASLFSGGVLTIRHRSG